MPSASEGGGILVEPAEIFGSAPQQSRGPMCGGLDSDMGSFHHRRAFGLGPPTSRRRGAHSRCRLHLAPGGDARTVIFARGQSRPWGRGEHRVTLSCQVAAKTRGCGGAVSLLAQWLDSRLQAGDLTPPSMWTPPPKVGGTRAARVGSRVVRTAGCRAVAPAVVRHPFRTGRQPHRRHCASPHGLPGSDGHRMQVWAPAVADSIAGCMRQWRQLVQRRGPATPKAGLGGGCRTSMQHLLQNRLGAIARMYECWRDGVVVVPGMRECVQMFMLAQLRACSGPTVSDSVQDPLGGTALAPEFVATS